MAYPNSDPGVKLEQRAPGVSRGTAIAGPLVVYPRRDGASRGVEASWGLLGASRPPKRRATRASAGAMLFAADGRPGGMVSEREGRVELVKRASARLHQLRTPAAWACDAGVLREAEARGASVVRIRETDTGREFVASLAAFVQHGFPVRRGFGEQRGLELSFWRVEDPRQGALFEEGL